MFELMGSGKLGRSRKSEKGFTLIELLVVAAIIGILLAIAIPNLLKARISANEASARKMMQTLWVAEGEYFEQDLDGNGTRDYTNLIGDNTTPKSLRQPGATFNDFDALIDKSFETATDAAGDTACLGPKAGYCIRYASDASADPKQLQGDFGWQASMTSVQKTGRKDFAVYADKSIRCAISTQSAGSAGTFEAVRADGDCN